MTLGKDISRRLDDFLSSIGRDVAQGNPRILWTTGQHSNEIFAVGAWLAFSRHGPGEEDVVVSVDFQNKQAGIEVRADIARGDGYVLAEWPPRLIDGSEAASASALDAVELFIRDQRNVIVSELS